MAVAGNWMTAAGSKVNHSKGFEISPKYINPSVFIKEMHWTHFVCILKEIYWECFKIQST